MTGFFFCIPLKSKRVGDDWVRVEQVLDRTLHSIFNQTDDNFTVFVACHDVPETSYSDRPNLRFLQLDHPVLRDPELMRADRNLKMRRCAAEVRREGGGYMFGVDYDDLVSNRIVQFVRNDQDPHGYLLTTGYEGAAETGTVWCLPAVNRLGPAFDKCCGTCAIFRFAPEDLPERHDDAGPHVFDRFCSNHAKWEERSLELGRPLSALPFRGAIYVVDSGMQISRWSGNRGPRMRLNEMLGRKRPMTAAERSEFGLFDETR